MLLPYFANKWVNRVLREEKGLDRQGGKGLDRLEEKGLGRRQGENENGVDHGSLAEIEKDLDQGKIT